jgi:hypothetical protein
MEKGPAAFDFEVNSEDLHLQSKIRTIRMIDGVRLGVTALGLLMSITVLGVSADMMTVYDHTHVASDFLLPLWPDQFNIRPNLALIVGSAVIVVTSIVSLLFSKVQVVSDTILLSEANAHG